MSIVFIKRQDTFTSNRLESAKKFDCWQKTQQIFVFSDPVHLWFLHSAIRAWIIFLKPVVDTRFAENCSLTTIAILGIPWEKKDLCADIAISDVLIISNFIFVSDLLVSFKLSLLRQDRLDPWFNLILRLA